MTSFAPDARLRRALTATPLARRLERGTSRDVDVSRFVRRRYPAAARRFAAVAQSSLAVGEWMAVDLFARLTAALALARAPVDLVAAAAKIPTDEVRHADLALRMAAALTDEEVHQPPVDTERHAYLAAPLSLEELDYAMLEMPAIGETLACALLSASRDGATDPVARAVFSSLLRDEVHHARLGWYYLAWRSEQWSAADRQRVADRAGNFVVEVEVMFAHGRDAPRGARSAARALGVLDTPTQRAAIRAVMEQEIVPGLDGLGLGASHAWRLRERVAS
ncbi:MAG TPA: ferritin-like domain-containing protein [Kofleriaceae bacterium]